MTNILYMKDVDSNYIKEFDAVVTKNKKDYILLDKTAFYPLGGGQPSDTGKIFWDQKESKVKEVIKKGDIIKHIIDGEKPSVGSKIHAELDWDKRYMHMKMHTAQHIISGIIFDNFNARTVGNQIHADYSRVDFRPIKFSDEKLKIIEDLFNDIVDKKLPIGVYKEERSTLEKRINSQRANLDLLPKSVSKLRIVEIKGFDICPCAGTHIKNTSELSKLKILRTETKGKDTERLVYTLEK